MTAVHSLAEALEFIARRQGQITFTIEHKDRNTGKPIPAKTIVTTLNPEQSHERKTARAGERWQAIIDIAREIERRQP